MPCYEPRDHDHSSAWEALAKLDNVTALLCYVMRQIEGTELSDHCQKENPALAEWWIKHKEHDSKR